MSEARRSTLDAPALALLLGCCVLWGLNQVATKVALAEIPPLTQAALRSAGAALLLAAWARWRGIALLQRDGTLAGGLLAGTLFAGEFACIFIGLQFTAASRMVVFIYLAPFVVALGMPWIARGERLAAAQWLGLALAFGGVAWAFAEGFAPGAATASARQWIGDALGLAAALLWGGTTLAIRATRLAAAAPEKTLAYQLVVSALLLGVAAVALDEAWPRQVGALAAGALAFQIVVVTFASYLVWFWLVRHYPATRISAFTLLTPVSGLAAGVVLLDEPLTARLGAALAAVVFGLVLVNRR
ncbi:MAG TPA: DMT family transporter [Burkholderiaceae bacterium]|nr:DMT family transporter [Burkholderiaceae bacterium]